MIAYFVADVNIQTRYLTQNTLFFYKKCLVFLFCFWKIEVGGDF